MAATRPTGSPGPPRGRDGRVHAKIGFRRTVRTLRHLLFFPPCVAASSSPDAGRATTNIPIMDIERINAIGNHIADLSERTTALRGYL